MNFAKFTLRVLIGGLFVGHGTQKLYGWFEGPGLEGTDKMMDSLEMHPARRNSMLAGATEAGCGALLVAGLATPVAAAGLIGTMTTAIRKVHAKNGPWNANGGWEFNSVMIAALATLVEAGPGKLSLDAAFGHSRGGPGKALFALGLGLAASTAAIEMGRREAKKVAYQRALFDRPRPGSQEAAPSAEAKSSADAKPTATSDRTDAAAKASHPAVKEADTKAATEGPDDVESKTDIDSAAAQEAEANK